MIIWSTTLMYTFNLTLPLCISIKVSNYETICYLLAQHLTVSAVCNKRKAKLNAARRRNNAALMPISVAEVWKAKLSTHLANTAGHCVRVCVCTSQNESILSVIAFCKEQTNPLSWERQQHLWLHFKEMTQIRLESKLFALACGVWHVACGKPLPLCL